MKSIPFLEDIYPPGLLYGVTIRSPVAKGQLKNIEVPELPDGFSLVSAKDIPGENRLYESDMPILADKKLSYIGEPVAILLGHDKTKLEDLAGRCIVAADEETDSSGIANENVISREITIGDTQKMFENTDKIVTGSFISGIQEHWYAEPVGACTWWKEKQTTTGKKTTALKTLVVRTATQWPYHVKNSVCRVLGLEAAAVSVEPTALNLHMDGKLWYPSLIACHAALGTYITKSPVRLILRRNEDFLYTPKRCGTKINITSSIDDNGNITSSDINISVNLGAHEVNGQELLNQVCFGALGLYNFKNLKLTAVGNCANIPPQGPFSGFGLAQGLFAIERHFSQIADMVDVDPAELRIKKIDTKIILPSQTQSKNIPTGEELINTVTKMSDYYRKWASCKLIKQSASHHEKGEILRGIGIAAGFQGNDRLYYGEDKGIYSVEVTLTKESLLEIKTSITSPEDYNKIWQKVAADTISIQPDMVRIVSAGAPDSGPSCASRNITVVTKLVEKCCLAIRKQRFHDPLPITVRRSTKPQSGFLRHDSWKVKDVSGFTKPAFASAVVEVTIDPAECIPRIRGVWLAVDGGKIISKHRAKRSLTRAAIQALGWTFTEDIEYINGILPRKQYDNFKIFSPIETPPIEIDFLSPDSGEPKGIGELAFVCIPAAFMQAVSQAMDHCFKNIPLRRHDIWEMVKIKNDDTQRKPGLQEPK